MKAKQIKWPEDLLAHVEKYAKSIGSNFSTYIRTIAAMDSRFTEPKLPIYTEGSRVSGQTKTQGK